MGRWDVRPEPYPDDSGVRARQLDGPVDRPERARTPMAATRRDGSTCDIRRSLGLPSLPPLDEDQGVRWTRWP